MSIDPVSIGLTLAPTLIDLFSGNDKGVSDELLRELTRLSRFGVGVGKLAAPGAGAVNAASGQASSDINRSLARTGMSNTGAEVGARNELFAKRGGALSDVYAKATAQNEQIKQGARDQLMRLLGMRYEQSPGQSLGNLAGVGIEGLLRSFYNSNPTNAGGYDLDSQIAQEVRKALQTPTKLEF